jgi:PBP1b-binding outer membrane lipoprotein LpoB
MTKKIYLLGALIFSTLMLTSCGGVKPYQTGINSQTQRVDSKLSRSDYTLIDQPFSASVVNKKKFKKYSVDQLKEAAFMEAEKTAIMAGADGVLNPVYMVDQKRKRFYVTARVKGYKLKSDNEYLDMENNLRHNPNR